MLRHDHFKYLKILSNILMNRTFFTSKPASIIKSSIANIVASCLKDPQDLSSNPALVTLCLQKGISRHFSLLRGLGSIKKGILFNK